MTDTATHFAVPDVALQLIAGGEIDPVDFRGQKLAVFFCPVDAQAAAQELADYRRLADGFAEAGVWVFGVLEGGIPAEIHEVPGMPRLTLAADPDGRAWRYFKPALPSESADRTAGAAFFFERWGSLRRAWSSSGHAEDVLLAARERN